MSIQAVAWAIGLAGLSQSEKLVLIVVSNYADDLGFAWPSQETLARDASMTSRSVRTAIARLEGRGILRRRRRYANGERSSDMLHLAVGISLEQAAAIVAERDLGGVPENFSGTPAYRKITTVVPENHDRRTGKIFRESVSEPSEEPSEKTLVQKPESEQPFQFELTPEEPVQQQRQKPSKAEIEAKAAERFESDFWPVYPRRTGKKAARAKFVAIVRAGEATADEIVRGAMRYAAARTGEDERYTKQPVTWLNQGCWDDEYPPPRRDRSRFGDRPKSLAEIMLEQTADSDECSLREVEPRSLQ